jgi:hypothetical protein
VLRVVDVMLIIGVALGLKYFRLNEFITPLTVPVTMPLVLDVGLP